MLRFPKLYDISYEKFIHFWGKTLMSKNTMIDHEKYIFSEVILDLVVPAFLSSFFFVVADFIQLQTRKEFCSQGCDGAVHLVWNKEVLDAAGSLALIYLDSSREYSHL